MKTEKRHADGLITVPRRHKGKRSSWRFQSLIRLTDTMSEERMRHLVFEASDKEFDEAIQKLGGKVIRHSVC